MDWHHLGIAISLFNRKVGVYPDTPLDPGSEAHYADYVELPETAKSPEVINDFLNKWGRMRHHYAVTALGNAVDEAQPALSKLKGKAFESTDLRTVEGAVTTVFELFLDGTDGSSTAASKVLHLFLPELAPMWDRNIRIAYGCGYPQKNRSVQSDAYLKFANRLRSRLDKSLKSYSLYHKLSDLTKAAQQLRGELYKNGEKSMVKIVDEYNYMKFTKCANELWS